MSVGVGVTSLTLLIVIHVSDGDRHLSASKAKSRSILGVRSNCLCRLLSKRGVVFVVRSLGFKLNVRDSVESSRIKGRLSCRRVSNRGDFWGISDEGEGEIGRAHV